MNLDNYYYLVIGIDLRSKLLTNLGDSSLINMLGLVSATSFPLLNNGVTSAGFLVSASCCAIQNLF